MADYIKDIRKIIGHKPLLSVGLGAFILNEEGKVLLEKRADNGLYCTPGGSIDLGETLEEGLIREVKEEVGLILDNPTLFYILSGNDSKIEYPNGDITYYVSFFYFYHLKKGETPVINDNESTGLYWFSLDELKNEKRLLPGTEKAVIAYLRYQGKVLVD